MVDQNKTVKRKVVSEITYWTIAAMISTIIGLAILGAFTVISNQHHSADIDRLDSRIDLECIKK